MSIIKPWPKLSETPRAARLKELVLKLRQIQEERKESFFDQDLEDSEAFSQNLSNQIF